MSPARGNRADAVEAALAVTLLIERVARRKLLQLDAASRISELVHGARPITADTALRLGLFFGMEPRFWLNLQAGYDMRIAERTLREKISPRVRVDEELRTLFPKKHVKEGGADA